MPSDEEVFTAIWADPVVWTSLSPGKAFEPSVGRRRFKHHLWHWEEHGFGLFAAIDRESEQVAGWIGPAKPDFAPELAEEVELGWSMRQPFRGRGLVTEGARAAVAATFEHLPSSRIISLIEPWNERSLAVARRLGMTPAGESRHATVDTRLLVMELPRPAVLVRQMYEAAARRDGVTPFEHYAEDIVWEVAAAAFPVDLRPVYHGHEGVRRFWRDWVAAFDAVDLEAEEIVEAGTHVLVDVRERERGRGSGIELERRHYAVWTVRDGKIARMRVFADRAAALRAAGA